MMFKWCYIVILGFCCHVCQAHVTQESTRYTQVPDRYKAYNKEWGIWFIKPIDQYFWNKKHTMICVLDNEKDMIYLCMNINEVIFKTMKVPDR